MHSSFGNGGGCFFSAGSEKNIKLTTVDDIDIFKALLVAERSAWLKEADVDKESLDECSDFNCRRHWGQDE